MEERRLLAITVDTLTDEADGSIVDGDVSLRDAIALAPVGETIDFSVTGEINIAALGQLTINKSLSISGPGPELLTISGNDVSRVLLIDNGSASTNADVEIGGLTFARGRIASGTTSDNGGAILSRESLTLDNVTIVDSFADEEAGGLYASAATGGQIIIRNSLITGNEANRTGGGAYVFAPVGGVLRIEDSSFSYNKGGLTTTGPEGGGLKVQVPAQSDAVISGSTFSGNWMRSSGGGLAISQSQGSALTLTGLTVSGNQASRGAGIKIFSHLFEDSLTIAHSTITGNKTTGTTSSSDGGGIYSIFTNLTLEHTIVAGNQAGAAPDIRARDTTITSRFSLVGDNTGTALVAAPLGTPDANGNLIGTSGTGAINPRLAPLANVGGATKTHALLSDSPALDAGNPNFTGPPHADQRGSLFARVVDGDALGGARIDVGAFERQPVAAVSQLVVSTASDEWNGDLAPNDLSLREAVALANANVGTPQTISFHNSLAGRTIRLRHGALQLIDTIAISGLGAEQLAIEGIGFSRLISIDDGNASVSSPVEIRDLSLRGGNAQAIGPDAGDGGGIRTVEDITLERSRLSGNVAAGDGGGVYAIAGNATIQSNVFQDNQATLHGGALTVGVSAAGTVASNSLLSNTALRNGGGMLAAALNGGALVVRDSLLSGNDAVGGGGAYLLAASSGQLTFTRNDVRGNRATAAVATPQRGGGGLTIGFASGGQVNVTDSTFFDNEAVARGGAIEAFNSGGQLRMSGLTISGNRSLADAGGIWALAFGGGTNLLAHSTVTGNVADSDASGGGTGGGVFVAGGLLQIRHVVAAGNTATAASPNFGISPTGTFGSGAGSLQVQFSLIGDGTGSGLNLAPVGSPDANGNLVGGAGGASINAQLGPLADNGGPTWTHALLVGSPAIDAGDMTALAGTSGVPQHDQRGAPFARVFNGDGIGGARIDMGAIERQTVAAAAFGDFNGDGTVDAADYTKWRDTLGQIGVTPFSGADGDGDGAIDADDYNVWRANFGSTLPAAGGAGAVELLQESNSEGASTRRRSMPRPMDYNRSRTPEAARRARDPSHDSQQTQLRRDAALLNWLASPASARRPATRVELSVCDPSDGQSTLNAETTIWDRAIALLGE